MNQNQSGHVSSPNCFPSGDMIPYANKMLAVMQNDPRFAGKTFSQADLLNWFGAEGRRWCSKQELFEKLPAPLKQKLTECNNLPESGTSQATDPNTGAPLNNIIVQSRSYCLTELDSNIVQWMLTLLVWDMLGLEPGSLPDRNPELPRFPNEQKLPQPRRPDGGLRLPHGGLQQSPDDPIVGDGECSKEHPFSGSTGYSWCETKNACIPPTETCPAPEPPKSKTAIVLGVVAGIAAIGTAAYWYATRSKAATSEQPKSNPSRKKLRSELETDEVEQEVRELAESRFEGDISPVFEHGQWFVTVSPDPDDPSDENSEATYSVVDTSDGFDLERL